MTLNDLCAYLLPPDIHLQFKTLRINGPHLILAAAMQSPKAACPDCRQLSGRIHSSYWRTLADLPWASAPIELRLNVRRFFCLTCTCPRQTFTERLPAVAPLYARTTMRLATAQADTGLALGGAAGARHLRRQGAAVSRQTLLRRVQRLPLPECATPQIIGLDDWAWRKGHHYGTLIVDLQRGCPIDVLEDRASETVAAWLQAHPEVEVVTRDRAQAYAAGIRQGNPQALQVADRFHLLQNLAAALQEVFRAHHQELNDARGCEAATLQDGAVAVAVAPPAMTSRSRQQAEQSRTRRLALYEQIWALRQKGWTIRSIATHVGHDRRTVLRYLQASTFPERQPRQRRGPTLLDPFKSYLLARWQSGCHHAKQLFGEIKSQGFRGQYSIVAEYTSRLRTAQERVSKRRSICRISSPRCCAICGHSAKPRRLCRGQPIYRHGRSARPPAGCSIRPIYASGYLPLPGQDGDAARPYP